MFKDITLTFVMSSAIWYHLCNLKNVKNAHGGVSLLVKSNTPQRAFFAFFKLYKWYQITQIITYVFSNYVVCSVVCPCSFSHMLPVYCRRKGKTEQSFFDKATIAVDFRGWWCHGDGDTARISQRKPQKDPNAF